MAEAVQDHHDLELDYIPQSPTLKKFHRSKGFMRVVIGPLGSAKTQSCMVEVHRRIHNQKARVVRRNALGDVHERISRWAVIRNTYADLQSTTIKDWREMFSEYEAMGAMVWHEANAGKSPTANFYYSKIDGTIVRAEVMFLAYDRPQDQRKIRGLQVTGLWLNEIKELNHTVVSHLLGRIGRFPAKNDLGEYWQGAIGDCNAPDSDHWLGELALGTTQPRDIASEDDEVFDWEFFIQPWAVKEVRGKWVVNRNADNIHNLPTNYYQRQIAGAVSKDWIRVNLGNMFILYVDGRPVHPDFNQLLHTSQDLHPTPGRKLIIGLDFGRTPAAAILQRQIRGNWFCLDELCTKNTNAKTFGRTLRRYLNEKYEGYQCEFWGDPSGEYGNQSDDNTPFMLLATEDIEAYPTDTNDFSIRTGALDGLLKELIEGEPAFMVSSQCKMIVKGLAGGYQFRKVSTAAGDRYHHEPQKDDYSHPCEALHYALQGAGEGAKLLGHLSSEQSEVEAEEDFEGWHVSSTGL